MTSSSLNESSDGSVERNSNNAFMYNFPLAAAATDDAAVAEEDVTEVEEVEEVEEEEEDVDVCARGEMDRRLLAREIGGGCDCETGLVLSLLSLLAMTILTLSNSEAATGGTLSSSAPLPSGVLLSVD